MKKIFLTSGLVLCMACPAFANISADSTEECTQSVLGTATDGATATFVAQWTKNTATITLDSKLYVDGAGTAITNGRAATTDASPTPIYTVYDGDIFQDQQHNTQFSGNFTVPTLTGYAFGGFYTEQNGSGTQKIASDGTYTKTDLTNMLTADGTSATLYAKWTAVTSNLTYSCGSKPSGAGSQNITTGTLPADQTLTYDATWSLAAAGQDGSAICSLQGWHFTTWDCTGGISLTDASGTQSAWANATANSTVTCTPHWEQNEITIAYTSDGDQYDPENASTTCLYDTTFEVPDNIPTKTGYTFNGWLLQQ